MRRRPPGSTRTDTFPTRRSSDLDDLSRGVRVGVLDVVTVEERVLHDLPVDRLLETFAAHAQQLIEPIARHDLVRSEEHTSELQSLMRISYAVFCLKTKNN